MKITLFVCLLTAQLSHAADSLIVNAGRNSRVVFYGKTPADLQNLERLDLNKLLRDLNQTEDSTSNRIQLSSDTYQISPKPVPKLKQFWNNYKKNTYFNFYIGTGSYAFFQQPIGRYEYFRQADPTVFIPNPPIKDYTFFNSLWLRTRSLLSISLVHDVYLLNKKRVGLKLRYGVGMEALGLRFEYSNVIKTDVSQLNNYELMSRARSDYFNTLGTTAFQTDVRSMSYNAQLMPKVFLKNKKGQETFHFGLGIRYNSSTITQPVRAALNGWGVYGTSSNAVLGGQITFSQTPIVMAKDVFYSVGPGKFGSFTFMSEIGYKSIAVFANYTPTFTKIKPNFRENLSTNAQYFNPNEGNLGFYNFGIRIGR